MTTGRRRGEPQRVAVRAIREAMAKATPGIALLCVLSLSGIGVAAGQDDTVAVVYHLNSGDTERQLIALGEVQNHIDAVGAANLDIRFVIHGRGLDLLSTAPYNADIRAGIDILKLQGVRFEACGNTIKARQLNLDQLYGINEMDIVPSGVAQISLLQSQGYTYIKP